MNITVNFNEHNCDLFTYLFVFHMLNLSSNMNNALFYILYLVMYFIDSILILHTTSLCYLFVSSIIKQYITYIFLPRVSVLRYMKIL